MNQISEYNESIFESINILISLEMNIGAQEN